jgi:ribosomal protein S18 acetylase RimI-like enzyme
MMNLLELVSDDVYKGFFVDLYVRCTNDLAINMYEGFGYSVYRRVEQYYGSLGLGKAAKDEEDAFGECVRVPWSFLVFITSRQTCENHYLGIHIEGL